MKNIVLEKHEIVKRMMHFVAGLKCGGETHPGAFHQEPHFFFVDRIFVRNGN